MVLVPDVEITYYTYCALSKIAIDFVNRLILTILQALIGYI